MQQVSRNLQGDDKRIRRQSDGGGAARNEGRKEPTVLRVLLLIGLGLLFGLDWTSEKCVTRLMSSLGCVCFFFLIKLDEIHVEDHGRYTLA